MKSFSDLIDKLRANKELKKVAVAAAEDKHTLEAIIIAQKDGLVKPVLVGEAQTITQHLMELNFPVEETVIIGVSGYEQAAYRCIELINNGEADFIMKGKLETATLMKAILNKESNMRTGNSMSHLAFVEIPSYHKLLALTDVAMNTYPDLDTKKQIIENAVEVLHRMGIASPKVAIMSASEEVNPKLVESQDAYNLKMMNISGEIGGCIIEGPISYDLAIDKESVEIKKYDSPVGADTDLMVVPNLTAGNLLIKSLTFSGGAKSAGFVVGAKVPIVLTSRASTTEDKYMSILLAASAC